MLLVCSSEVLPDEADSATKATAKTTKRAPAASVRVAMRDMVSAKSVSDSDSEDPRIDIQCDSSC